MSLNHARNAMRSLGTSALTRSQTILALYAYAEPHPYTPRHTGLRNVHIDPRVNYECRSALWYQTWNVMLYVTFCRISR